MPFTTRLAQTETPREIRRETMQITGAPAARRRAALIAQLGETVVLWQTTGPISPTPTVVVDLVNAIRSLDERSAPEASLRRPCPTR